MSVTIYTIQMAKAKQLPEEFNRCDVTFMSKDLFLKRNFAPPNFNMIKRMKKGDLEGKIYDQIYYGHLDIMSRRNEKKWKEFLQQDNVVLMCFCSDKDFCHRHSLADYLRLFAIRNNIEFTMGGELDIDNLPDMKEQEKS